MTTEEKAKAYDEVIKRAESLYKVSEPMSGCNVIIETLFHKLSESEDERIRKELIAFLKENHETGRADETWSLSGIERLLTWLEKQGEHANFRNKIQIGDKVTRNRDGVLVNLSQLNRVAKHAEKQGEQKPAEEYNITGIGSKNAQGKLGEMIKNIKPVNEVLEQKPAWSEEDRQMKMKVLKYLSTRCNVFEYEEVECWLKSLKERVQPKQEWSEEDESRMDNLCHFLEEYGNQYYGHLTLQGTISWLKSLRPQSQWKPSKEQMKALEIAIRCGIQLGTWEEDALKSLAEQLKKLKGE